MNPSGPDYSFKATRNYKMHAFNVLIITDGATIEMVSNQESTVV